MALANFRKQTREEHNYPSLCDFVCLLLTSICGFSWDFEIYYTCGFPKTVLGLLNWLSEVEVFAMIFAAAIHDYEHTGTTNTFHTQTRCAWGDYFLYLFPFYTERYTVTVSKLFIQML